MPHPFTSEGAQEALKDPFWGPVYAISFLLFTIGFILSLKYRPKKNKQKQKWLQLPTFSQIDLFWEAKDLFKNNGIEAIDFQRHLPTLWIKKEEIDSALNLMRKQQNLRDYAVNFKTEETEEKEMTQTNLLVTIAICLLLFIPPAIVIYRYFS